MNQMGELDLKLTRLSAIISPYLTKFIKHNKSSTVFSHEIVIIFSPLFLSVRIYGISLFSLKVNKNYKKVT